MVYIILALLLAVSMSNKLSSSLQTLNVQTSATSPDATISLAFTSIGMERKSHDIESSWRVYS